MLSQFASITKSTKLKRIIRNSFSSKRCHTDTSEPYFASSSILNKFNIQPTIVDTSLNKENGLNSYIKRVGFTTGKNLGITTITGALVLGSVSYFPELILSVGGFSTLTIQ